MKKIMMYLSYAMIFIILIVALVIRFKYPHLTDIQFFLEYWYLYVIGLVGIAFYGFGKGMMDK